MAKQAATIPADVGAEAAVIWAAVYDRSPRDELVQLLDAADFYAPVHQDLWSALVYLHEHGGAVSLTAMQSRALEAGAGAEAVGKAVSAVL